jgi:hypothetical protein
MFRTLQYAIVLGIAFLFASHAFAESNPVFDDLTKRGVVMPKGPVLKLPAPTMPDGLDAAAQRKAIQSIADERRTVEAIIKKSLNAPTVIKTGDDNASSAAGGTGKRVDFYFVVYGDLKKIADEGFWGEKKEDAEQEQLNPNDAQVSGKLLTAEELKARRIEPLISANVIENYGNADVQLFNRVRVRGTSRSIQTKTDESVTYATLLDPRFVKDEKYPNQWQSVSRDDAGKLSYGPLRPYTGLGAYAKATTLKEPEGAIFLEYHMVFDEPQGWFNGANVIRTKVPAIVQDNVKKLRRKLAEKEES